MEYGDLSTSHREAAEGGSICNKGLQNTIDIQLPRTVHDGKLEVSLVAMGVLNKYDAKYEDSEGVTTVQDSKGHTYKVIRKAVFRWRMKGSCYTQPETFYITNGLRDDVDALLREDIGGSFQNRDNAAEGFVLEMPKQSDGKSYALFL